MVLQYGKMIELNNSNEVFNNPKQEYTKKLIASIQKF